MEQNSSASNGMMDGRAASLGLRSPRGVAIPDEQPDGISKGNLNRTGITLISPGDGMGDWWL